MVALPVTCKYSNSMISFLWITFMSPLVVGGFAAAVPFLGGLAAAGLITATFQARHVLSWLMFKAFGTRKNCVSKAVQMGKAFFSGRPA